MALISFCYNKTREWEMQAPNPVALCQLTPSWIFWRTQHCWPPLSSLGFRDTVLSWCSSYFSDHCSLYSFTSFSFVFFFLCPTTRYSQGSHLWLFALSFYLCSLVVSSTLCSPHTILQFWPVSKASILQCKVAPAPKSHLFETELNILNQLFLLLSCCERSHLSRDQGLKP